MSITHQIIVNQLSQDIQSIEEGMKWFKALTDEDQVRVLDTLIYFLLQAGAVGRDVEVAISSSGLKETFTPCQLLLKAHREEPSGNRILKQYLAKVVNLPKHERLMSFSLLIHLFRVADNRKRGRGLEPDRYWWHRDLSDQETVEQIILQYKAGNLMTDNEV